MMGGMEDQMSVEDLAAYADYKRDEYRERILMAREKRKNYRLTDKELHEYIKQVCRLRPEGLILIRQVFEDCKTARAEEKKLVKFLQTHHLYDTYLLGQDDTKERLDLSKNTQETFDFF